MKEAGQNRKRYADDKIEVSYDAHRCIHAAECMRGLPAVFNDRRRPWIVPSAAAAEAVAAVIAKCPSGALHFRWCDGRPAESPSSPTLIVPTAGGPLYVRGRIELMSADGTTRLEDVRMALCRCGQSHNKPFCDNSHFYAGFDDPGAVPHSPTSVEDE